MPDELLLRAYGESIEHSLDQEFIELLERELSRRGKHDAIQSRPCGLASAQGMRLTDK
jgi:hypothetical protein